VVPIAWHRVASLTPGSGAAYGVGLSAGGRGGAVLPADAPGLEDGGGRREEDSRCWGD